MDSPIDRTGATRIISKPDGSEALVLERARIQVLKGPDKGKELLIEGPRVRIGTGGECELQLSDAAVSRRHLELCATPEGLLLRDLGSTNGTLVAGVRLQRALLTGPATLVLGQTTLKVSPTKELLELRLSARTSFGGLLGRGPAMRQIFAVLEQVAPTDSTVLLEGESGTGKEVAADALHRASRRAEEPMVVVDCGSIPPTLIESELFGHERGAFTGAAEARAGALEQADRGTLFLDEIGELPLELQPRLLRFLESGKVKRLGASQPLQLDVRVVAATNRHLAHEVKRRAFREDLFYRLAVVRLELPPLRERLEDLPLLAHHFLERLARDPAAVLTDEILGVLRAHAWPGNVRELRNVVERLVLLPEQALSVLRQEIRGGAGAGASGGIGDLIELPYHEARTLWQEKFERQYLAAQLERAGGVVTHAATKAELPRQSFHRMMRRHGLKGAP